MVHLAALPGAPGGRLPLARIIDAAVADATMLAEAGFDALMIENFGDTPFRRGPVEPHTVAAMTLAARAIRQAVSLPLGINVLRNDGRSALAIAHAVGGAFVRINVLSGVYAADQGLLEGDAAGTLRYRRAIGAEPPGPGGGVRIFADVHVKHAAPMAPRPISEAAGETAYRAHADGLIVSGTGTGKPTDLEDLRAVRAAVPDRPLWVGSGATPENAASLLAIADGLIVGTSIKRGGQTTAPVDPDAARRFVEAARKR